MTEEREMFMSSQRKDSNVSWRNIVGQKVANKRLCCRQICVG